MTSVLVVDDQEIIRRFITAHLAPDGYAVCAAGDGEEAWSMLTGGEPVDVVLLDRRMPGLDGMALLARIKDHPELREIPVILQTAADREEEIAEGIRAGAYYYLTKPLKPELLRSITRAAATDAQRYRDLRRDVARHAAALALLCEGRFEFRAPAEGDALAVALAGACPSPRRTVVGLSELFANAVEHGNLEIGFQEKSALIAGRRLDEEIARRLTLARFAERKVVVEVRRDANEVVFTISDDGAGFDWRGYMDLDPSRAMESHGRGIVLARRMSFDSLSYEGNGSRVVARVRVQADETDIRGRP